MDCKRIFNFRYVELEKISECHRFFNENHQDALLKPMVARWLVEAAGSIKERADHGFMEGDVYKSVIIHSLTRNTNGPRLREIPFKIDPELELGSDEDS